MMTFNLDEWFPNFTLFVLVLAPALILITYALISISRFMKLQPIGNDTKGMKIGTYLGYVPILYMFYPVWEIAQYIMGNRGDVVARLFTYHFGNIMIIIVIVGIGQILALLYTTPARGGTKS